MVSFGIQEMNKKKIHNDMDLAIVVVVFVFCFDYFEFEFDSLFILQRSLFSFWLLANYVLMVRD